MAQYAYGYVEPAEKLLHAAGEVLGLQVELTGEVVQEVQLWVWVWW
jgi:hypothetical protein